MTPKQIVAAVELSADRKRKEFAINTMGVLMGTHGDPKKTNRALLNEIKG